MQSEENQLSNSADFCHIKQISEINENDSNSINKALRGSSFTATDSKAIALDLLKRIEQLEHKLEVLESREVEGPQKKKKMRRRAKEIARTFKCQFVNCGKEYGSEASLKNHKKLKHGIRLIRRSRQQSKAVQKIDQVGP